jgi:LysM repeat protein
LSKKLLNLTLLEKFMGISSESDKTPAQATGATAPFKQRFTLSTLEIIFGGLVLLGLLYMGYFILFQDNSGTHPLDKKIKLIENYSKEQDEKSDKKFKSLQESLAQLELRMKKMEEHQAQTENSQKELLARTVKAQKQSTEIKKPSAAPKEKVEYKVKKGETLSAIAKRYKVTREDLARWNKIDKNKALQTGEILIILPQ